MDQKSRKQQALFSLYQKYENCLQCPLAQQGRTQVVFGEGNCNSKIMLIGEAPGKYEDIQGKPFVGRSGQLLNATLELLGFTRSDVYITNIVKCRPPLNRAPAPIEIATCKKLLLTQQIEIIAPSIICTLGAVATTALLESTLPLSKIRGNFFSYQSIHIIPTFHPAYILRKKNEYPVFFKDIQLVFQQVFQDRITKK